MVHMSKKIKIIITAFCIITAILMFLLRPKSLNDLNTNLSLSILYTYMGVKQDFHTIDYEFSSDDKEFKEMVRILESYTYHNWWKTWSPRMSGFNHMFSIYFDDNHIIITDTPKILIDKYVYRVGYFKDNKSKNLFYEISSLLGLDLHYQGD